MALNLARIIGTLTGKVAFERTNANFQAIETEVNANTIAIDEKLPTSHNTDAAAHEDIRERINDLESFENLQTGKKYKYKFQLSAEGKPQIIYEEVV